MVKYSVELQKEITEPIKEMKIPVASFVRTATIEKLKQMGKMK